MNGYLLLAETYRKLLDSGQCSPEVANKHIRIYEFLATCDVDDLCIAVDSTAFNDIITAMFERVIDFSCLSDKNKNILKVDVRHMFEIFNAKECLEYGKK